MFVSINRGEFMSDADARPHEVSDPLRENY